MTGEGVAPGRVTRLLRICQPVSNLARAEAFYRDGLGFARSSDNLSAPSSAWLEGGGQDGGAHALRMCLGEQEIELVEYAVRGRPYPEPRTSADPWFQHIAIVSPRIDAAYDRVSRHPGFSAISRDGPVRLPPGTGSVTAFKFRDPDGHPLELIHFPPGTGSTAWRKAGDGVCIGFDHTAICVADVAASLAFYGGSLGLAEGSRSLNHGAEQARLDDLDDPLVDVIGMDPAAVATPHVEFLGYRSPRANPQNIHLRPNDIACSKTVVAVDGLAALIARLDPIGISVRRGGHPSGGPDWALLRDPDGHHLILREHFS